MPARVDVQVVNAFVKDGAGGNPAGVVVDADGLSETDMQMIAAKVGVSETAFVSQSAVADFKLDFFTPNMRIAHCGHATIATFAYLAAIGRVGDGETSKETIDGTRRIRMANAAAYMEQLRPRYEDAGDWAAHGVGEADVLNSLGIDDGAVERSARPVVVSTGNRFLLVGVRSRRVLASLMPDFAAICRVSEAIKLIGYYVFARDGGTHDDCDATTRMFAPYYAIEEESATGTAAGPLACLLHDRIGVAKPHMVIEQGVFMKNKSPSVLTVDLNLKEGAICDLMVGGRGRLAGTRTVEI